MKTTTLLHVAACAALAVADLTTVKKTADTHPTPSKLQVGEIINTCNDFIEAQEDDDCRKIVNLPANTITFDEFVLWNPTVGPFCSKGLMAGQKYCVGVQGTPKETASPSRNSDSDKADNCGTFYQAVQGDTCRSVVAAHGALTFEEFVQFNPTVGYNCANGLLAGGYYFVAGDTTGTSTSSVLPRQTRTL